LHYLDKLLEVVPQVASLRSVNADMA
jgi:hypothetical protein